MQIKHVVLRFLALASWALAAPVPERAVEAHHGVDAYPLPESLTGRPKRDLGDIEAHHAKDAYALPESMIDVLKRADDLAPHHGRDAYPLPDSVLGFVTI